MKVPGLRGRATHFIIEKSECMLTQVHPKLPMRSKSVTKNYYIQLLGFEDAGSADYDGYLMVSREGIEIHFFEFRELEPANNYGQVYIRTTHIDALFEEMIRRNVPIHPNAPLETKPWGQREFSLLDPDHNLLTFGQGL
jgi:hypothetical protein